MRFDVVLRLFVFLTFAPGRCRLYATSARSGKTQKAMVTLLQEKSGARKGGRKGIFPSLNVVAPYLYLPATASMTN